MTPPHTEPRDFRVYLRSVWRWKWPVLALLLVVPALSYALETRKVQQYTASALVQADAAAIDPSLFPTGASADGILTIARLVQTRTIANAAGKLLEPTQTGNSIRGLISVQPDTDTGFLTISATAPQPRRAAEIANAFARAISANRAAQSRGRIDAAINGLKRQRARLTGGGGDAAATTSQRTLLDEQMQKLRAARSTLAPRQGIIELAMPSVTAVGRNPRRAIELGVVIALLLSAGVIALAEGGDRRLRTPDDLEALTELPLLSVIPATAFSTKGSEANDDEAFGMLRAALTYFNVDRRLTSIVIASAGQEDGKTTVAVNLAYALARAGSRVILVDADLRHPRIGPRLGLAPSRGLADVLSGTLTLREALIDVPIRSSDPAPTPLHGALKLLPAGTGAPNPAELLSSPELVTLLRTLETNADYVVVDSAAALAVSDALPLLSAASAIVLVARLNRSTKHAVRRLVQVIAAANGTVVGVVATGASARAGYGYGYGYSAPGDRRRGQRDVRQPKPEKAQSRRSSRSRARALDPSGNEETRPEPAAGHRTTDDPRWPQPPADSEPQIAHAATETPAETPPQNGQSKKPEREPWTPIIRHTDEWGDG